VVERQVDDAVGVTGRLLQYLDVGDVTVQRLTAEPIPPLAPVTNTRIRDFPSGDATIIPSLYSTDGTIVPSR